MVFCHFLNFWHTKDFFKDVSHLKIWGACPLWLTTHVLLQITLHPQIPKNNNYDSVQNSIGLPLGGMVDAFSEIYLFRFKFQLGLSIKRHGQTAQLKLLSQKTELENVFGIPAFRRRGFDFSKIPDTRWLSLFHTNICERPTKCVATRGCHFHSMLLIGYGREHRRVKYWFTVFFWSVADHTICDTTSLRRYKLSVLLPRKTP